MSRRYPIFATLLAAGVFLAGWPGAASAQNLTNWSPITPALLAQAPYSSFGALLSTNTSSLTAFEPFVTPYNIGGGAIAEDAHLVQSTANLPYNISLAGNIAAFTQKNYFVQGFNSSITANGTLVLPTPAQGKPLAGYAYGAGYSTAVAQGGFFLISTLAVSFASFFSLEPLTTNAVPAVVDISGANLGSSTSKLLVGYAGIDLTIYQTGSFNDIPVVVSDPLWDFLNPNPPIGFAIVPLFGGAVWVKVSGQWAYEGVVLTSGSELGLTGTAFELMNSSNLDLISAALGNVTSGNRTGPPRPGVNATNVYLSLPQGGKSVNKLHIQVANAGTGTLHFTVASSATWLKVSPASGTSVTAPVPIALNFNTLTAPALTPGTYNTVVDISSKNSPQVLNVQLQVTPVPPPPPSHVTGSRNRSDGVLVTWQNLSAANIALYDVDHYDVYRSLSVQGTGATKINPSAINQTPGTVTFLDSTAVPQQPYHYFVKTVGTPYSSALSTQVVGVKRP
jgi:hypothetical protein